MRWLCYALVCILILRLWYYESQKLKECFPLLLKPLSSNQAVRDLEL